MANGGGDARRSRRWIRLFSPWLCIELILLYKTCFSGAFVLPLDPRIGFRRSGSISLSSRIVVQAQQAIISGGWYPRTVVYDDDIFGQDEAIEEIEQEAIELVAQCLRKRLDTGNNNEPLSHDKRSSRIAKLVENRFIDLACTIEGEQVLESLFDDPVFTTVDNEVVRAAVMVLQSLCVMGTQLGVKGAPEQLQRMVSHLDPRNDPAISERDLYEWDRESVRRLKYRLDRTAAVQLLARMSWRRTPQGAFDLLVGIGAWQRHEDLALLRSGFPLRFTREETEAAQAAMEHEHDPDALLGLRQDLRNLKVYTVDSASTSEIDDGLSVEVVRDEDGTERHRLWIHIADADRWAPRNSTLLETARKRITSLYLPHESISMFPPLVSTELMSLKANHDVCALSLGVELNEDGSIDASSLVITPSLIRVSYRLTYEDVDEMLEEGIGYNEEWELGALSMAAAKRRQYRMRNGSSEAVVPNPVPYSSVSIFPDPNAPDEIGISVNVEVSHNAGKNQTSVAETGLSDSTTPEHAAPASSAYLLVTECMILAGEAIGQWRKRVQNESTQVNGSANQYPNQVRLPFRTQPPPDFKSRSRERRIMENLLEDNVGDGLCHSWYSRRFLQSVKISEEQKPHSGLGLDCYVQWTSPIRRFSDLQTHASVKRYLRRKRVYELVEQGSEIPAGVSSMDLGLPHDEFLDTVLQSEQLEHGIEEHLDQDLDFLEGVGLIGAARVLQRRSQQYWLFEYIRRLQEEDPDVKFTALVLGCVDPERRQYAIYLYELGLEHRYTSPGGRLNVGTKLPMKVDNVSPRAGILNFVRAV